MLYKNRKPKSHKKQQQTKNIFINIHRQRHSTTQTKRHKEHKTQHSERLKAWVNKYVFNNNLKLEIVWADLMLTGNKFHSFGPATEKARSPLSFNLALGIVKSCWSEDLKDLAEVWRFTRASRYVGAKPFKDLKTNTKSLYSIRKRTGNHLRENKIGVICSCLRVPVSSLAAAFWTTCRRAKAVWLTPIYIVLQ